MKVTENVQVAPAARADPVQPSLPIANSASPAATVRAPVAVPPLLVMVKVAAVPDCPTCTLPRLGGPEMTIPASVIAIPVRLATTGVDPAVASVTVRVAALSAPGVVGLNTT